VLGGVKVDGSTISINAGVITANYTNYSLPTASTSILGGVKVDGTSVTINNGVITATPYSLPTATTSVLGGVKVDGTTISINGGMITANYVPYSLPLAGTGGSGLLGGVKVDGTSITINTSTGVISSVSTYSLPSATTSTLGGVIIPAVGTSGINNTSGTIGLATASNTQLGGVKVDGSSVIINNGTISVPIAATVGANSGIATLDSTGHLTSSQIPTSLAGAVIFKGTWNANTNTPTLTNGSGTAGWEYAVSTGGTALGYTFNAGDYVIYNGTTWQQIPGSGTAASAGTLTGTTLASNVINSSLTSVGTLTNLTVTNTITGSITGNAATVTSISGNTLTSTQVTNALGFTPLQSSSLSVTTAAASGAGSLSYATGVFTFTPAATYNLPTATNQILGGVKVDGTTITINNGIITSPYTYTLPTATTSILGGVKVDGSTITINNGVISSTGGSGSYSLPTATTSILGGVKIDGTTITINNGVITSPYTYTLPQATTSVLGGVKVDGTTITSSSGTISTVANTRNTVSATTVSLSNQSSATATVTIGKGYVLYSIQVSAGAWVTLYTSSTAQSNDNSRSITTDPTPGSGVVAEAITTVATTTYFSPAVFGYNNDVSVSANAYLKIYNNSGSSAAITVTLTYLRLE